nr:protein TSSC4 [Leptinotarsa decemlineata]
MAFSNNFSLKSDNAEFTLRQKSVFDQLIVLEKNRKTDLVLPNDEMEVDKIVNNNSGERRQRSVTKHFRGKESIFKKPQNPVPKNYMRSIPDFKKNPHKWTKYSIDDVEDISDESNTRTALNFLNELRKRKTIHMECDQKLEEVPNKIIFHKPNLLDKQNDFVDSSGTLKSSFISSKVVMPEYVVGQKKKKERKNKIMKPMNQKELKLDHLLQDEEDE